MNGYLLLNSIGLCVLIENLKSAAYYLMHTNADIIQYKRKHEFNYRMNDGSASYAFISGSGLDIMLKEYSLDYNSEEIRSSFYRSIPSISKGRHPLGFITNGH